MLQVVFGKIYREIKKTQWWRHLMLLLFEDLQFCKTEF